MSKNKRTPEQLVQDAFAGISGQKRNLQKLNAALKSYNKKKELKKEDRLSMGQYKNLVVNSVLNSKQLDSTKTINKKVSWSIKQIQKEIMGAIRPEINDFAVKTFSIKILKDKRVTKGTNGKNKIEYSKLYNRIGSYLTRVYKDKSIKDKSIKDKSIKDKSIKDKSIVKGPGIAELIRQSGEFVSVPEKGSNVYKLEVNLPPRTHGKIVYTKLIIYVEFDGGTVTKQWVRLYDSNGNQYDEDGKLVNN